MQIRAIDNDRILEIAKKSFKIPVEIWAFGSRIKNTATEGSDLDLVAINITNSMQMSTYLSIFKENIKHSNIPIFVQIFDWDSVPPNYQQEIKKEYQIYFKN